MNYLELRRSIDDINDTMPADHPCKSGDARCCYERDIPLTPADEEYIASKIRTGKISERTIENARRNARDETVNHCPFLGPNNECTIYEFRPILCGVTGNGALLPAWTAGEFEKEVKHYKRTGEDRGFATEKTESCMCNPCHLELNRDDKRFSIKGMLLMREVALFIRDTGAKSMITALRTLPTSERKRRKKR